MSAGTSFKTLSYRLLLVGLLIGGCSNESTTPSTGSGKSSAESPVTPQEALSKKSVAQHERAHRKPGADVSLAENVVHRLEPGVAADVALALTASYKSGELVVTLNASEGLMILDGPMNHTFSMSDGETYSTPLRVMATNPGRYYIRLRATVNHEGRRTDRVLSAIVQVGPESTSDKQLQKADSSDGVIPLPAEETIIQH